MPPMLTRGAIRGALTGGGVLGEVSTVVVEVGVVPVAVVPVTAATTDAEKPPARPNPSTKSAAMRPRLTAAVYRRNRATSALSGARARQGGPSAARSRGSSGP